MKAKLLIVGNPGEIHVGAHFFHAAQRLGLEAEILDVSRAFSGSRLRNRFQKIFFGNRPSDLEKFSRSVQQAAERLRPRWVLVTGIAPVEAGVLKKVSAQGALTINYLTDDPWNPGHKNPWFMKALAEYDLVFSPRRSNIGDLEKFGCKKTAYLPFAYAPEIHFPPAPSADAGAHGLDSDVLFVGAADKDRLPYMHSLIRAGFKTALYGAYWDRFRQTRSAARGIAYAETLRLATASAKVCVCLVRRANRDGHCMRTFEIPAIGACMLAEDTAEHREIFGAEGKNVLYFDTPETMTRKAAYLTAHEDERSKMAEAAHALITGGRHAYMNRLAAMLGLEKAP